MNRIDSGVDQATHRDMNLAFGCALCLTLVVLVGLIVYLWTL